MYVGKLPPPPPLGFECLTLLRNEVIEYEKSASKWPEMHSQGHRFRKKMGELPRNPLQ